MKTLLRTQLKQTNVENQIYISTESSKEGFNDTVFQHFVDELKHCNSDMPMGLQLLVAVFLCLYSIYLVVIFSAIRRRRDIKISLCLSAPVQKSLI